MNCYDELKARGLIAQVTNEEEISKMINNGEATFYIGFDPTADSLHVGHFMALCLMKRLQMAGNKPIALVGGGTGMIGDPSGRSDLRKVLTIEDIDHNCECFKKQMSRFIEFGEDKARMVNNADWLSKIELIPFLRDIGKNFSMADLTSREFFKSRIDNGNGLSFAEFTYTLLQGYDFWYLHKNKGVSLQIGGSDQWGNLLSGVS